MLGNIYIETSILKALPFEIVSAPFVKLRETAEMLKMSMYVPRLSLEEYVNDVRRKLDEILEKIKYINAFINSKIHPPKEKEELLKEVESKLISNLVTAGVKIIATPTENISINELTRMSLYDIPPFKSDRGFRDAIIFLTILTHAKKTPSSTHIFLTADRGFYGNELTKIIKDNKVELQIFYSLDEASDYIEKFIKAKVADYIKKRRENLKEFLRTKRSEIEEFIRKNGEFSMYFLQEGLLLGIGSIQSIKSINLIDIKDAFPEVLDSGIRESWIDISFEVKLKFTLIVERQPVIIPKLRMEGISFEEQEIQSRKMLESYLPIPAGSGVPPRRKIEETTVDKEVTLRGRAYITENDKEDYKELELKDILTGSLAEILLTR